MLWNSFFFDHKLIEIYLLELFNHLLMDKISDLLVIVASTMFPCQCICWLEAIGYDYLFKGLLILVGGIARQSLVLGNCSSMEKYFAIRIYGLYSVSTLCHIKGTYTLCHIDEFIGRKEHGAWILCTSWLNFLFIFVNNSSSSAKVICPNLCSAIFVSVSYNEKF